MGGLGGSSGHHDETGETGASGSPTDDGATASDGAGVTVENASCVCDARDPGRGAAALLFSVLIAGTHRSRVRRKRLHV